LEKKPQRPRVAESDKSSQPTRFILSGPTCGPTLACPHDGTFNFCLFVSSTLIFFWKNITRRIIWFDQIPAAVVAKILGFKFFLLKNLFFNPFFFLPQTPIEHHRNRDKPIYDLKNHLKTKINPNSKINLSPYMFFHKL
jgi:hypothetical protein